MKLAMGMIAVLALGACKDEKRPAAMPASPAAPAASTPAAAPTAAAAPVAPTPTEAPTGTAADVVRLGSMPPKVGDKVTEVEHRSMTMDLEVGGGKIAKVVTDEARTEQKEVLAVDGDVIARVQITYAAIAEVTTVDGKARPRPSPIVGKTYVVWREGDEVRVSYPDGAAPSADEVKLVVRGNRSVGRPDELERLVAEKAWRPGEKVAFTADELVRLNRQVSGDGAPSLTAMSLTLERSDATTATLALVMVMEQNGPDGSMHFELLGTASFERATGRVVEMAGVGPFRGKARSPMTGTMSVKTTYAY